MEKPNYTWKREDNGFYVVTRWDCEYLLEKTIRLKAKELFQFGKMLLAKEHETWTLYVSSYREKEAYLTPIGKLVDGIIKFRIFGKVFLYQNETGWYVFFYDNPYWYDTDFYNNYRCGGFEERKKAITRLCEPNTEIFFGGFDRNVMSHRIDTSEGIFLLYPILGDPKAEFIKILYYEDLIISGYVKLNLYQNEDFYLFKIPENACEFEYLKLIGPFNFKNYRKDKYMVFGKKGESQQLVYLGKNHLKVLFSIEGKDCDISEYDLSKYDISQLLVENIEESHEEIDSITGWLVTEGDKKYVYLVDRENVIIKIKEEFLKILESYNK